jgi:sec-independent protein translocase protein TatC
VSEQALDEVEQNRMSIIQHLHELRKRLVVCLWASGICMVVAFFFAENIFDFLVEPMNLALEEQAARLETADGTSPALATMAITDPMEGIITYLKVALLAGLLVASPVLFYQGWSFVAPGLYKKERRTILPLVAASTTLFLGGASFGYFVIFKYGFSFFLSVIDPAETSAVLSINSYLVTATKLLMAFGFSFQLPVVIFFLSRLGLIDHTDMIKGFRYAVVGIFCIAAAITPPDPLTQSLMAGPLILLYILSIAIAWGFTTKVRDEAAEST